jgi:hypothetical protein
MKAPKEKLPLYDKLVLAAFAAWIVAVLVFALVTS